MDRTKYPSVTEVLGKYVNLSAVRPDILEAACARGTAVHAASNAYALGLWIPTILPAAYSGYLESFCNWFDQYVGEVIFAEKRLYDDAFGFKGKPDLCLVMKGDPGPSLVEIKTPVAHGEVWCAQLAAYRRLVEVNNIVPKIHRQFSLRLKAEGGPPVIKEYTSNNNDLAAFMAALTAHKYFGG